MSEQEIDVVKGALWLQLQVSAVARHSCLRAMLSKALGPVQVAAPDQVVLGGRKALKSAVINAPSPRNQLLCGQELGVI